jgi:hypothetical protein
MDEGFANEIAKAYLVAGVNERASGSTLFCGLGVHSTTAALRPLPHLVLAGLLTKSNVCSS